MSSTDKNYWKSKLTLSEILDAIENLPEDISCPDEIVLAPPPVNYLTDEESGSEEEENPSRFSSKQLQAEAEVTINGFEDDTEIVIPCTTRPKQKIVQHWIRGNEDDLPLSSFCWKQSMQEWNETRTPPLQLSAESTPLEFFQLFFDEEFAESVVRETMSYATKNKNSSVCINRDDFYAFCGVLILSGYVPLPRRRMFWEEREDSHNLMVSKWMRRNKFEAIFTNLHFMDNDNLNLGDRFSKVRPFISHLNNAFLRYAPVEMNISIDEAMIPYYGRNPCKQFIRNKPVRFGYKAWVAASRLGYCYQFEIYQGRSGTRDKAVPLGEDVVLTFANTMKKTFPEVQFAFYFDNFFTSPNLMHELKTMQYSATGTLRENRLKNIAICDKKNFNKKKRGEYQNFIDKKNELIVTRWKDNQVVTLLSNVHGVHPIGSVRRYVHTERKKCDIKQPNVVKLYNKNMEGVDLLDNHIANYRICIRGKKWYAPIVTWMIDLAVTNAHSVAKNFGAKLDGLEFRRQLAEALLTRYGKLPTKGRLTKPPSHLSSGAHVMVQEEKRLRCKECKSQTLMRCKVCRIALHRKIPQQFEISNFVMCF